MALNKEDFERRLKSYLNDMDFNKKIKDHLKYLPWTHDMTPSEREAAKVIEEVIKREMRQIQQQIEALSKAKKKYFKLKKVKK